MSYSDEENRGPRHRSALPVRGHNTRLKENRNIHKKQVLLASRKDEFSPKKVKGLKARG
jgi:hypothetical protein